MGTIAIVYVCVYMCVLMMGSCVHVTQVSSVGNE